MHIATYKAEFRTRDGEDRAIIKARSFDEAIDLAETIAERKKYQLFKIKSENGVKVFV